MPTKTIPREANDKSKGFTLQKLRATSLMLSQIKKKSSDVFIAAVEYGGDVYLDDGSKYVEENKAYDSKDFSFASGEIKNTLVYFLDFWLNNHRDDKIRFGFYATNKVAKEIKAGKIKELGIALPKEPILSLLKSKAYDTTELLPAVKKIILKEYEEQYASNKQFPISSSHFATIKKFNDEDWKTFLNAVEWNFEQPDVDELEEKLIEQIKDITIPSVNIEGKEAFIRAQLFYDLEIRQAKQELSERFVSEKDVELTFRRVAAGTVDEGSYKYLSFDYSEVREKTKKSIERFIADKYHAVTGNANPPLILERKVALLDPNLRWQNRQIEVSGDSKKQTVEGLFGVFVNAEKPVFLFGELGSGKSTIAANHVLSVIEKDPEIVPLFIPSSYLQGKEFKDIESLSELFSRYANLELTLAEKFFDFDLLFKTGKEVLLVVDGVDELLRDKAQALIRLLKTLKENFSQLRVIATGRPLELQGIIPSGWHTLATLPLKEEEIQMLLKQEALAKGLGQSEAEQDAEIRLNILNRRPELKAVAITPLVICSIQPDLNEALRDKSLGEIIYDVVLRRLDWHEKDAKGLELTAFLNHFPHVHQREKLLGDLAAAIFQSTSKAISEARILDVLSQRIPDSIQKNQIVDQAVGFFKSIFLQRTTDDKYGFASAPVLECGMAINSLGDLKSGIPPAINIIEHWRSLSFAMAIIRRQDLTDKARASVAELINRHLQWPNENIAQTAIVLSELRDPDLANHFIDALKTMAYRPIRLLQQDDHSAPYALAYCIHLGGNNGFNWFYDEYLDNRTPLIHYEAKMVSQILGYYFIITNFSLERNKQQLLQSIIKQNISFATSLCFELLPCLSLIALPELPIHQRCLLLVDLLKDSVLQFQAKQVLSELHATHPDDVLTALETVSRKMWRAEESEAPLLWLQLNQGRALSRDILENAITAINKDNCETILSALYRYVPKDDLFAYLRFSILTESKISGQAALILFWNGDRDYDLLAEALATSIDWLSRQYNEVDEIATFITAPKEKAAEMLIRKMPLKNHMGIPPSYWRIFLDALLAAEQLYLTAFLKAVEDLRPFVLTRYPDVRLRLTKLLYEKPLYKDELRRAAAGLHTGLRNNANSILLTCFPDQEAGALVSLVSGFFRHASSEEWHSFVLGLNYSEDVLDKLYAAKDKLVEGAKAYAFVLLRHHQHPLTESDTNEMVQGLLGPGYFFDRPGLGRTLAQPSILSSKDFLNQLTSNLTIPDINRAERAASLLLEYHASSLTLPQLAMAHSLQIENFEEGLFRFVDENDVLHNNDEFVQQVIAHSEKTATPTLLSLFYRAQKDGKVWKELFLRFVQRAEKYSADKLESLLQWLISYARHNPDKRSAITEVLKELLLIPAYKEDVGDSSMYLYLQLMADQFSVSDKKEILGLLSLHYHFPDEEVLLALALRSDFVIPDNFLRPSTVAHSTLFALYSPNFIAAISTEEFGRFLVDEQNISVQFLPIIEQVTLTGQPSEDELNQLSNVNNLAAYAALLVNYCRGRAIDVTELFKVREIGGTRFYQQDETEKHRQVIWKFYRILLRKPEHRTAYYEALKCEMDDPNSEKVHEYLLELLAANEPMELRYFQRLLDELLDRPFYLREQLAYYITEYFVRPLPEAEQEEFKKIVEKFLLAVVNHYEKEGTDDQYNLHLWLFALVLLRLSSDVPPVAQTAFLLGLRYVFLERNDMQRMLRQPPEIFFRAKDLLTHTHGLLSQIEPKRIHQIIVHGSQSNVPEVNAVCRVLFALIRH